MTPREKLRICNTCEQSKKNVVGVSVCSLCGCLIPMKVFGPISSCPLGKWAKQEIEK